MEEAIRYAALALAAALAGLLIKRHEPGLALLVALAASLVLLTGLWQVLSVLITFVKEISKKLAGLEEAVIVLLRVLGIILITKIGSSLCKDAGENALSLQLELVGNALALIATIPLFNGLLALAGSFLGG
jgi:stage III sporulation protein AD